MNPKTKVAYFSAVAVILALSLVSFSVMAKNENAKNSNSAKSSQSKEKKEKKSVNLKNYEKPDKTKGITNAQIHREKTGEVVENLQDIAKNEATTGNSKISNRIKQIVAEQAQEQEQVAGAIEEVETRGKLKSLLIGTNYKNLGQLRSQLVHNRNQIRILTRTMSQVQNEGDQTLLQQQLETLMQERERIKAVITANEDSFSLLGWVVKFLSGYDQTPINEEEEAALTDEVQEAIENAPAEDTENGDTTDTTDTTETTEDTTTTQTN